MKRTVCLCLFLAYAGAVRAQEPETAAPSRVIGEVTVVRPAAREIGLKPDAGGTVNTVTLGDKTLFLRVPPGEKDLKKASRISLPDVAPGDRIYARGQLSEDKKSIAAVSVIVMTKADLAQKHEADRAEWQRRGTAGIVTALDPAARQIALSVGPRSDPKPVLVETADTTGFRRYAPDSVRFSDARPSSFAELRVGDSVRVLGDRSEDGSRIKAAEVVSGSFRNLAALIKSVDAASGEIRATDLETKETVTVRVAGESMLRRLPPVMAQFLARTVNGGAGGWPQPPGGGGAQGGPRPQDGGGVRSFGPPPGAPGAGGPPGMGGGSRGQRPDFQQMMERLPALTLAELKPGDAVIISATRGADASRLTVVAMLAGVEPLLSGGGSPLAGMWTFDIGLPQ